MPDSPDPSDPLIPIDPKDAVGSAGSRDGEPKPTPVARPASGSVGSRPLIDLQDDSCPKCGASMAPDAVLCMRCGFDQRAGTVRRAEVGVDHVEPPKPPPEFVAPGRVSPRTLAIVGVCITIGAMVAAGASKYSMGFPVVAAIVILTLYNTLLHSATGLAAVALAAILAEERFSRAELAAARMFVAFAIFQCIVSLWIPGVAEFVSRTLVSLVAAGAYFLALMILFRKDHTRAGMIAALHLALWCAVNAAAWLSTWLRSAIDAAPQSPGA